MLARRTRPRSSIALVTAVFALGLVVIAVAGSPNAPTPTTGASGSAFPEAEVVHVVAESDVGEIMETWVDQRSGDALTKTTANDGTIRQVEMRRGTTLSTYIVTGQSTGLYERTVLAADDPVLSQATSHLDGFRWSLERGRLDNLGADTFKGQPALKTRIPDGELAGTLVYLDPATRYPMGYVFPDGSERVIAYTTIETPRRADVPAGAFDFAFPEPDFRETYHQLSADDIDRFTAYSLVNLGPAFERYQLFRVERFQSWQAGQQTTDKTYSVYRQGDAAAEAPVEIQVICRPPLSETERAGVERAVRDGALAPGEPAIVNGAPAAVRPAGQLVALEIERADVFITVLAPDRETALAAGAALRPAIAVPAER